MSEDRVALSVPHGGSYLLLCFPEEVTHLMAEHIIWQAQPVETGRSILPGQKILLSNSRWIDREAVVSNACCISPAHSRQIHLRYQPGRCLRPQSCLWRLSVFCTTGRKTKCFSLGSTAWYRQVIVLKFSIIFSPARRAGMDDAVAADRAHQQGKLSRCRSS